MIISWKHEWSTSHYGNMLRCALRKDCVDGTAASAVVVASAAITNTETKLNQETITDDFAAKKIWVCKNCASKYNGTAGQLFQWSDRMASKELSAKIDKKISGTYLPLITFRHDSAAAFCSKRKPSNREPHVWNLYSAQRHSREIHR